MAASTDLLRKTAQKRAGGKQRAMAASTNEKALPQLLSWQELKCAPCGGRISRKFLGE